MMQLENLTANFQGVQIEYTDIVNYEIARKISAVIYSYYPENLRVPHQQKRQKLKNR